MKSTFLIVLFYIQLSLNAAQFSVLTCSRGEEIYSTFGHSAIRYQDSSQGIDWVYNYGLFDFYDPNFIPKFCMGKLDYMVGKESMNDFMGQYVYQQREVKEQVLNLSDSQNTNLLKFLEWNILDKNKYYRYDFLYNNCATKILEVLEKTCPSVKLTYFHNTDNLSFRQLIHSNACNSVPWIDWGMDLALGIPTDKKASDKEYCFLPEFVYKSLLASNLVSSESVLIPAIGTQSSSSFFQKPIFFALLILVLSIYLRFTNKNWGRIIWSIFLIILGIGGLIIGFEWFMTEHTVTKSNWNLGCLNPLSLIYGLLFLFKKENRKLEIILFLCATLTFVVSILNIQEFHIASRIIIYSEILYFSRSINKFVKKQENL